MLTERKLRFLESGVCRGESKPYLVVRNLYRAERNRNAASGVRDFRRAGCDFTAGAVVGRVRAGGFAVYGIAAAMAPGGETAAPASTAGA
ncbi:MAG: hypothetical protein HY646_14630 [Acidobacteria bacterium]|nr:hypothetical protein [Acidobacteriota bacterium]